MRNAPLQARPYNPLLVLVAVVGAALPAALGVVMVDLIVRFSDGAVGPVLWCPLVLAPVVCGIVAYIVGIYLDPNVPKLALFPAVVTTIITSLVASFAAVIWLVASAR